MANQFDFTKHIDRHGRDAAAIDNIGKKRWGIEPEKADPGFDEIPMWVADMNFETSPAIIRAISDRLAHPLFGYFSYSQAYYDSIIRWQRERNGYGEDLTEAQIGYQNGVHGCVATAITVLTEPGDYVFVHRPAYAGFLSDLEELNRKPAFSDLKKDADGIWRMDYEDMENCLKAHQVKLAIFCSPHNPTGRVWEKEEVEQAMEVFRRCNVTVISDEIWSDLILGDAVHTPTCLVSEDARQRTISLYAPSKTFNLAGLIGSYHIIWNEELRSRIQTYGEHTHYNEMNVLSMHALIGAYGEESRAWLAELIPVIEENCRYAVDYIRDNFEGCSASMPQGTYMVFMDCEAYCKRTGRTMDEVLKAGWKVGVAWQDGRKCGAPYSIRLNCALPLDLVQEAFARMHKYVFGDM